MSDPWCYLLRRYGDETGMPTRDEISAAAKELYEENLPGITECDYEEHSASSLRYVYNKGPMYVLEITRHGSARWEQWADQDYETELCRIREVKALLRDKAVFLWNHLAAGEIEEVRSHFPTA